jgi:O-antigen/teichoic acid export membrane protein
MKFSRKLSYPPQVVVGIGVAFSGLSQAILLFAPSATLPPLELAELALWISLSGGIGILISSVVSNSLFYRIVRENNIMSESDETHKTTFSLFIFTLAICLGLYVIRSTFFSEGADILGLLLSMSILLQFFASVQRSYYSGNGQWIPLSGQMAIDGFLRVLLTFSLISLGNLSLATLLSLSVLSQICSIALVSFFAKWGMGFSLSRPDILKTANESSLLFISAGGSLVLTTFTPVILKIFNAPPEAIALAAALLIVSRLPSSILLPIAIPVLRDQATLAFQGEGIKRKILVKSSTLKLIGASLILVLVIQLLIQVLSITILDLSIISDSSILTTVLLIFVSLAFVLEGFQSSLLNSLGMFSAVARIYAAVIPILLWSLSLNSGSIDFVLAMTAIGSFTVALFSSYYANKLPVLS